MILLINVKVTQLGLSYYHRSPWMPVYDRLDIFKYCLASYAALLPVLTKCVFYIQLEQEFAHRQSELEDWIRNLFPEDLLELHWYRNNYTRDWRQLCEQQDFQDDDLIWYAGNDDHIFIDYDLDVVKSGIELLNTDDNPLSTIYYSHWPEQMRLAHHHAAELTADGNYVKYVWRTFDAIRIVKGYRFKRYWSDTDFGDDVIFRTDTLWHAGYELTGPVYAPTRELVRHYDGYSHVSPLMINIVPPLVIPPGFFDNQMAIELGQNPRRDGRVNFNPAAEHLYASQPQGWDYRWVAEDIPVFWRDRVCDIHYSADYDADAMRAARNSAFLYMSRVPMHTYGQTFDHVNAAPVDWFRNHLR